MDYDGNYTMEEYRKIFENEKDLEFIGESAMTFTGKGYLDVASDMLPDCHAFIIIPDPVLMVEEYRHAIELHRRANKLGVPVISSVSASCRLGAQLALGVNLEDHGAMSADLAAEVLDGAKPEDIPIRFHEHVNLYINPEAVSYIGLNLPGIF